MTIGCKRYIEKDSFDNGSHPVQFRIEDDPKACSCPLKLSKDMMESPTPHKGRVSELYSASNSGDQPLPHSVVLGLSQTRHGLLLVPPVPRAKKVNREIENNDSMMLTTFVSPKFGNTLHFSCQI
jgi:hypothetical protein